MNEGQIVGPRLALTSRDSTIRRLLVRPADAKPSVWEFESQAFGQRPRLAWLRRPLTQNASFRTLTILKIYRVLRSLMSSKRRKYPTMMASNPLSSGDRTCARRLASRFRRMYDLETGPVEILRVERDRPRDPRRGGMLTHSKRSESRLRRGKVGRSTWLWQGQRGGLGFGQRSRG
jgi:hypothetical protein